MNIDLPFNSREEIDKIVSFLKDTLHRSKKTSVVIASSGGIDSSVSLALSVKAFGPENVFVLSFPYKHLNDLGADQTKDFVSLLSIPETNFRIFEITEPVDACMKKLAIIDNENLRKGNVMARMRMIYLFDQAKKLNALVIGTENKSEYYLGYFTRFGDEASDIEPIQHLYKTQIYKLALDLSIPKEIINQKPTAGLWEGQTDESQLGFTYEEADKVLALHFDKNIPFDEIPRGDFPNRDLIRNVVDMNSFKHKVPYLLKDSL